MKNAFLNRGGSGSGKLLRYIAVLFFGAFASFAFAQTPPCTLTYDDGDLFLGFLATDRTSDYLVNIRPPAQFVNAPPGSMFPVDVGNIIIDLTATFGSDWYTRIDPHTGRNAVLWAVVGGRQLMAGNDPMNTLYSSNPSTTPWPRHSDTGQSITTSLIAAMGNTFAGNQSTPNNCRGLIQNADMNNSYAYFQAPRPGSGGISFQTWNPSNEGTPDMTLYLNRIVPGSGPSVNLGALVLTSSGQVNFSAPTGGTPSPTPTATATATGTPVPSPTPTASPSPTPGQATLVNISTRLRVQTGNNVLIGGFIVSGTASKPVAIRAIGPSLGPLGIPDPLADPTLELRSASGTLIMQDDNWQDDPAQAAQLIALGLAPSDIHESGLVISLQPGSYTAIVAGKNNGIGVGLVEVYDTGQAAASQLGNISTRGFVLTGTNVMIGGFFVMSQPTRVIIRAIGPSLAPFGVPDVLANPQLELHDATSTIAQNDNWQTTQIGGIITMDQVAEIQASGLAPTDPMESAIIGTLQPGPYTAIVKGVNNTTGNALVEVYKLP